jgi:alpha-mannosidase
VRIRLAADGAISSIYDKKAKREVISGAANRLLLWEDLPYSWDAWDVSHYYRETTPEQARLVSREIATNTPLVCALDQVLAAGLSTIRQRITLKKDSAFITIQNTVDWKESAKLLKVHAETSIMTRSATYEIQFGQIERPTHKNTAWDEARFEVAGHRYADISEDAFGFALINDCKYGYSTYGSSLELSLLRSPKSPDPEADMHTHTFTFGYLPHNGCLSDSSVLQTAHNLNSPVIIRGIESAPEVPEASWFSIDGEHVKLETVKLSETGRGAVLRLYEACGGTRTVTLHSAIGWESIVETDLLEHIAGTAGSAVPHPTVHASRSKSHSIKLTFKPYEIKTLLLS